MIWSYWCCQRQKRRHTWRYCSIWRKQNVDQIWSTKYRSIQGINPLFIYLRSGQIFCRYCNFKIWPWKIMTKVTGKVNGQGETNHPICLHYFRFVQIGPCIFRTSAIYHLTLKFRGQGQCRIQGKISLNLVAILVVIVAKTDSKYGINTCIGIYFFYFKLYFNLQITMKHSGH